MARITVEDCVKKIDRFSLVIIAAQRVREIEGGAPLYVPRENDKFPVVALREVAAGCLDFQKLENAFMRTFQKNRGEEDWGEDLLDDDPLLEPSHLIDAMLEDSFEEDEGAQVDDESDEEIEENDEEEESGKAS